MENFTPPTQAELDAAKEFNGNHGYLRDYMARPIITEVERLRAELRDIEDISLARLQFPDGTVPGNTVKCAQGWHKWCNEMQDRNARLAKEVEELLANNLCPDHRDKQAGKPCLACEIEQLREELGGLKARNLIKAIERICEKCGHNKTEDGCPHCLQTALATAKHALQTCHCFEPEQREAVANALALIAECEKET